MPLCLCHFEPDPKSPKLSRLQYSFTLTLLKKYGYFKPEKGCGDGMEPYQERQSRKAGLTVVSDLKKKLKACWGEGSRLKRQEENHEKYEPVPDFPASPISPTRTVTNSLPIPSQWLPQMGQLLYILSAPTTSSNSSFEVKGMRTVERQATIPWGERCRQCWPIHRWSRTWTIPST